MSTSASIASSTTHSRSDTPVPPTSDEHTPANEDDRQAGVKPNIAMLKRVSFSSFSRNSSTGTLNKIPKERAYMPSYIATGKEDWLEELESIYIALPKGCWRGTLRLDCDPEDEQQLWCRQKKSSYTLYQGESVLLKVESYDPRLAPGKDRVLYYRGRFVAQGSVSNWKHICQHILTIGAKYRVAAILAFEYRQIYDNTGRQQAILRMCSPSFVSAVKPSSGLLLDCVGLLTPNESEPDSDVNRLYASLSCSFGRTPVVHLDFARSSTAMERLLLIDLAVFLLQSSHQSPLCVFRSNIHFLLYFLLLIAGITCLAAATKQTPVIISSSQS